MKNVAFAQGIYEQSATALEELDTIRVLNDGRTYAYSLAGASALAAGKITQSAAPSANANKETLAADAAIGATSLSVTFGGAVTADFYKGGYIWANDDAGEATMYRVKGHPAGTTAVIVDLYEPVRVAMTAGATTVSAVQNRQSLVIVCPTTITAPFAGVPNIAVTAGYYFWNQVKGPCVVLTSGTVVIGNQVTVSGAIGAATPIAESEILTPFGTTMSVNATTEYSLINLAIPGY